LYCITDYIPIDGNTKCKPDINNHLRRILRTPLLSKKLSSFAFVKKWVLSMGNSFCCPTATYNKELLGKSIFSRSELSYDIDWDTFYLLGKEEGEVVYVNKKLVGYRVHDLSTSDEYIKDNRREKDDIYMFRRFWPEPVVKLIMHFYRRAYDIYE